MARHLRQTVTFIRLFFIVSLFLLSHRANAEERYSPKFTDNEQILREFEEFLEWKKWSEEYNHYKHLKKHHHQLSDVQENSSKESSNFPLPDPLPPSDHPALVGRYVVNQANWTAVATISRQKEIASFPFSNVVAISDGPCGKGSGVPYMFLTPLDFTSKDLKEDSRATLLMSLAQGSYCQAHAMEPIDPRCARIILSGRIKKIQPTSVEYEVAKNAVFGRHPSLKFMPADHHFYFAKLKIFFIAVLDTYGGAKFVTVKDYFNPAMLIQSQDDDEINSAEMKPASHEVLVF